MNPFEHHHDHDHGHDHDHDAQGRAVAIDPAQQSLSDALRVCFSILKVLMLVLVVLYLLSGIVWGVPEQKVAVRLRFGSIVGEQVKDQILLPGRMYFALPYPIEQVAFIPTAPQQLELNREFWYASSSMGPGAEPSKGPLNPERDGSLLTGDGNIIHAQWTIKYQVTDPIAFIRHVAAPSSDEQVVLRAAQAVVRSASEEGIIHTVAQSTADQASKDQIDRDAARLRIQRVLDALNSGITVTSVSNAKPIFPLAVKADFEAVLNAENEKARKIESARQEQSKILHDTAGTAFSPLLAMVNRYELASRAGDQRMLGLMDRRMDWVFDRLRVPQWAALDADADDRLWPLLMEQDAAQGRNDTAAAQAAGTKLEQLLNERNIPLADRAILTIGGQVSQALSQARAYRGEVVAAIQAQALAFNPQAITPRSTAEGQLAQYKRDPKVFVNYRLLDMVQEVLAADVETIYLPPGQTYLDLSRDPELRKQREEQAIKRSEEAKRAAAGNP